MPRKNVTTQHCLGLYSRCVRGFRLYIRVYIRKLLALPARYVEQSRVYETMRCPSVCLSQHGPTAAKPLLWVCCCGPGEQERLLQQGHANAGNATLSAYVSRWTQICFLCRDITWKLYNGSNACCTMFVILLESWEYSIRVQENMQCWHTWPVCLYTLLIDVSKTIKQPNVQVHTKKMPRVLVFADLVLVCCSGVRTLLMLLLLVSVAYCWL